MSRRGLAAGLLVLLAAACAEGPPEALTDDAAIASAVELKLATDPTVRGHDLDVDVRQGRATLSGMVRSRAAADRAVELARATGGVHNVIDRLTVNEPLTPAELQRPEPGEPPDAHLLRRVTAALASDPLLAGSDIEATVEGGAVTLTGDVPSPQAREVAGEVARRVEGVARVINLLTVGGLAVATPTPPPPDGGL